jgi:sporulation protein YlmC with PRC-barrel domain
MRKLQWSSFIFSHSSLKTSSIIGTNVVNFKGESLGDMREVIIDPCTGKVAYVVVSFGWFLGMAEKLFAVPLTAFEYNDNIKEYMMDVSIEQLKKAPEFDQGHWPLMAGKEWNHDVYKYYW